MAHDALNTWGWGIENVHFVSVRTQVLVLALNFPYHNMC